MHTENPQVAGGSGSLPAYLNVFEFTRLGRELSGSSPIMAFSRLVADLPPQGDGAVHWSLRGSTDQHGQRFLEVAVRAAPLMVCQRCLEPVAVSVDSANVLRLVATDKQLEAEDDSDDPQAPELLLGSERFDVAGLLEDELILALPYVPRHKVCPSSHEALTSADTEASQERSPFAVLETLKAPQEKK